jgi:3-oxosteroid 1-dehydrogenase
MTSESTGKISRRQFVGTAAAGAAALGVVAGATTLIPRVAAAPAVPAAPVAASTPVVAGEKALAGVGAKAQPVVVPSTWSYTADVVILGTGLAGLTAAIVANDAGANVLILEKLDQVHEGGNSRVAGNWLVAPVQQPLTNPPVAAIPQGAAYWAAMDPGTIDYPNFTTAKAQGFFDNIGFTLGLGANLGTWPAAASHAGPNSTNIQAFVVAPDGAPLASNGWPVGSTGDARLWNVYRKAVANRPIKIMYQTPATDLIQDPSTKEILGVKALSNFSQVLNIKANRGVILACGSLEFAPDLQAQYSPFWPVYGVGSPGNTGDGIRMAQKVGADLWHMNAAYSGSAAVFHVPGTSLTSAASGGVNGNVSVSLLGIQVNKMGNRFNMGTAVNGSVGGFGNETNARWIMDNTTLQFESIPAWSIFDDTARKKGSMIAVQVPSSTPGGGGISGWWTRYSGYTWSADNSAEVAKGWILSANSLSDLATKIAADPDNGGQMTGAQLQATVTAYNADVASGVDAQFLTNLSGAVPINGPPFYAIKLWPNYDHLGTGPGPRRNMECQIVDPYREPIPRLYSAGELGGFYYFWCTGGEHLSDCVWSGRIAGSNAALETPVS